MLGRRVARLIATLVGGMLTLGGLRQGGLMGTARGLLARGLTNKDLKILVGLTETGTIEVREGISVNAPVDEVFRFWENYQNFPRFMSNVLEVSDRGNGRSHWVVEGPAGTRVEWDAVLTNLVRNQLLAWESVPGSEVAQTGMVRFHPTPNGGTQINIDLSYTPPAGILGHMVPTFFGVNPEQSMNEDLVRFKSLIEYGKTTAHCETVTRDEVLPDKGDGSVSAGQPSQQANQEADQPMNQSTDKPTNQPSGSEPESRRESEQPAGGAGRIDKLEPPTGVFPASDIEEAPEDAKLQGMASWGQGERGAAGYEDHGESELWGLTNEEEDKGSPEKPKEENQK